MTPSVSKTARAVRNKMDRSSVVDGYSSLVHRAVRQHIEPHIVERTIRNATIGQCERTWGYTIKPHDFSAKVEYDTPDGPAVVSISYAVDSLPLSMDIRNMWLGVMRAVNEKEKKTLVRCLIVNGSIYPLG